MEVYEILMVIFTGIIAISAFYGLVVQFRGMIEERRARESEILMRITQRWDSEELIKARLFLAKHADNLQEIIEECEKQNREEYFLLTKVGNYFEDIASLVERGYLRKNLIKDLLGDAAEYYYKLYKPFITAQRQKGDTDLYKHFEGLAKK
ncbi:hypothetical protein M1N58_00395 [Dehalococcoidales bacterium]|nr:hypothetical protein [Dehalococcoidales bacterium]